MVRPRSSRSATRKSPRAKPGVAQSADAVSGETEAADSLRRPLSWIAATCTEMLADREHRPQEFISHLGDIRVAAQEGLQIVDEQAAELVKSPLSEPALRRLANDLPHKILKVYYRCESLLKNGEDWFVPFAPPLKEVVERYHECRAAIRQLAASQAAAVEEAAATAAPPAPAEGKAVAYVPTALSGRLGAAGRILIVDDDAESRQRLEELLEGSNHSVASANNGREALDYLDKNECDLVLLDLCMDGVDGNAVLREMREDFALRTVPVIVVSAAEDITSEIQCIELGADDFLAKPFDRSLLQARVGACLDKGAMRRNDRALHDELIRSKGRNDELLYQVFPYTVAQELRTGGRVQPRGCDNVAVLFCDLVGFTSYCSGQPAEVVVEHLDKLFAAFEEAVDEAKVEKIKTIGDCFMVTAGVLGRFANPVEACLRCAEAMRSAAHSNDPPWQVRIGIHVGPLVAGMVGRKQYAFDVWGDTVNTAARVQAAAEPGMIALSEPAWAQVYQGCRGKSVGVKKLKGKSNMEVFRFDGFRKPDAAG